MTRDFQQEADKMVTAILTDIASTQTMTGVETLDSELEQSLRTTPRHCFIPKSRWDMAYLNIPLPIGEGQTISQPFIVALMSQLLRPSPDKRILEVGTGSGYQAAVLAPLVKEIVSTEIVPGLAQRAAAVLKELELDNVEVRLCDGAIGAAESGPYDGIIVTAAPARLPEQLLDQLKPGGRLVIPIGPLHGLQNLYLYEKLPDGEVSRRPVLSVAFVPMTGESCG